MDVPGPSRCRCRETDSPPARNVRSRCPTCPTPDLVQSRRRRREEVAAATLAAHAAAGSGRNVRPRLALPHIPLSTPTAAISASEYVSVAPRRYRVLSELT